MATDSTAHPHARPALHGNEHPEMHEHSDVSIRGLAITIILFIIVGLLTHVMLYYLFWFLEAQQAKQDLPRSSVRGAAARIVTPEPRVQGIPGYHTGTPSEDTIEMKRDVHEVLSGYSPTGDANFVRIPIERAMELSLEQGAFKTRPSAMQSSPQKPAATAGQQPQSQPSGAAHHASH